MLANIVTESECFKNFLKTSEKWTDMLDLENKFHNASSLFKKE